MVRIITRTEEAKTQSVDDVRIVLNSGEDDDNGDDKEHYFFY